MVWLSSLKTPWTASCSNYIKPSSRQGVCLPVNSERFNWYQPVTTRFQLNSERFKYLPFPLTDSCYPKDSQGVKPMTLQTWGQQQTNERKNCDFSQTKRRLILLSADITILPVCSKNKLPWRWRKKLEVASCQDVCVCVSAFSMTNSFGTIYKHI